MSGGKCLMFALERIWGQTDRSSSYITGTELTVLQHLFTPTKPHSCLAGLRPRLFLPTPTPCPLPLLPQLSLLPLPPSRCCSEKQEGHLNPQPPHSTPL